MSAPDATAAITTADHLAAVAHAALDRDGPTALTVRKLAAAADVAPMTIYNQFGSKEGVVDRLVTDGFAALRDALRARPRTGDPTQDLVDGCDEYRRVALARPHMYSLMFERAMPDYEPSETCRMVSYEAFEVLVAGVTAAQQAGCLRVGDPFGLAEQLWAAIHGVVTLHLHGYGFAAEPDMHYRATVHTMLRGLA